MRAFSDDFEVTFGSFVTVVLSPSISRCPTPTVDARTMPHTPCPPHPTSPRSPFCALASALTVVDAELCFLLVMCILCCLVVFLLVPGTLFLGLLVYICFHDFGGCFACFLFCGVCWFV